MSPASIGIHARRRFPAWSSAFLVSASMWLAATAHATAQSCPANGLTLATTGGRLGDPYSLTLTGPPAASGIFAVDTAPGPLSTPLGTICLGLSAALQTAPFTLDAAGSFTVTGVIPPVPLLDGVTAYLQAAAPHPTLPGYVTSNGASVKLRPPRLIVVDPGYDNGLLPPFHVYIPGRLWTYDTMTYGFSPVCNLNTTSRARRIVPVRKSGLVVLWTQTGLLAVDPAGPSIVAAAAYPPGGIFGGGGLAAEGDTFFFLTGSTLRTYLLPSLTPVLNVTLPVTDARFVVTPGGPFAYVVTSYAVLRVNLTTGAVSPPVQLSSAADGASYNRWVLANGVIYVAFQTSSGKINGFDTATQTALLPSPALIPNSAPLDVLRAGPGTQGPALFYVNQTAGTLYQLSPTTLSVTAGPISVGNVQMELSDGGTEWLLTGGPNVSVMNPATLAITPTAIPLGSSSSLITLRSGSVPSVYLFNYPTSLTPIATDPTTVASPAITIPFTFFGLAFGPLLP